MAQLAMTDLTRVLEQVGKDKGISKDILVEALEQAMAHAAKKKYGADRDIEAKFNPDTGQVDLYEFKTVVEDDDVADPELQVTLSEAHTIDPEAQVGDSLGLLMDVSNEDFGRIAAQTAKQVIIQKVRDAEREMTYNEYKDRKGELVTGIVRRFEKGNIIVDLGRAEAILPTREQIPGENYRVGDRIQAFFLEIRRASRDPQIVLTRTHPGLLMKLFEMEVPRDLRRYRRDRGGGARARSSRKDRRAVARPRRRSRRRMRGCERLTRATRRAGAAR